MGNYQKNIPRACELFGTKRLSGNYSRVADALGAWTRRVEKPEEILPALEAGITATREGRPALLEFITCEEPDMAIG